MKIRSLVLMAFLFGVAPVWSQDAVFVAPEEEEFVAEEYEVEPRATGLQGIVAQVFRVLQPLQLINPFAPKSYGTGEANVSQDDSFGQTYPSQPGLIVFGVETE